MGKFDFLKPNQQPEESIPESMQDDMYGLWNAVGLIEDLHDNSLVSKEDLKVWARNTEQYLAKINNTLAENNITPSHLQQWMNNYYKNPKYGKNVDWKNRFWISFENGHAVIEVNHFQSMYSFKDKYDLALQIDGGKKLIPVINKAIAAMRPAPKPGELERWLRSSGLAKDFTAEGARIIQKK